MLLAMSYSHMLFIRVWCATFPHVGIRYVDDCLVPVLVSIQGIRYLVPVLVSKCVDIYLVPVLINMCSYKI